jgi:hypothetical protein
VTSCSALSLIFWQPFILITVAHDGIVVCHLARGRSTLGVQRERVLLLRIALTCHLYGFLSTVVANCSETKECTRRRPTIASMLESVSFVAVCVSACCASACLLSLISNMHNVHMCTMY